MARPPPHVDASSLCLHSWELVFAHPVTGERVAYEDEAPAWINARSN